MWCFFPPHSHGSASTPPHDFGKSRHSTLRLIGQGSFFLHPDFWAPPPRFSALYPPAGLHRLVTQNAEVKTLCSDPELFLIFFYPHAVPPQAPFPVCTRPIVSCPKKTSFAFLPFFPSLFFPRDLFPQHVGPKSFSLSSRFPCNPSVLRKVSRASQDSSV